MREVCVHECYSSSKTARHEHRPCRDRRRGHVGFRQRRSPRRSRKLGSHNWQTPSHDVHCNVSRSSSFDVSWTNMSQHGSKPNQWCPQCSSSQGNLRSLLQIRYYHCRGRSLLVLAIPFRYGFQHCQWKNSQTGQGTCSEG